MNDLTTEDIKCILKILDLLSRMGCISYVEYTKSYKSTLIMLMSTVDSDWVKDMFMFKVYMCIAYSAFIVFIAYHY